MILRTVSSLRRRKCSRFYKTCTSGSVWHLHNILEQKQAPRLQPEPCQAVPRPTRIPGAPVGCRARPSWQIPFLSHRKLDIYDCFLDIWKFWSPEYPNVALCCRSHWTDQAVLKVWRAGSDHSQFILFTFSCLQSLFHSFCCMSLIFPVRISAVTLPLTILRADLPAKHLEKPLSLL